MKKLTAIAAGFLLVFFAGASFAQKSSPLVLEPGRYSYSFGVPSGWNYSFEQARRRGLKLLYYPEGCLLRDATSTITIGEICRSGCSGKLSGTIQQVAESTRERGSDTRIASAPPLKIRAGGEAEVRIVTHARAPQQVQEALAFIGHEETIVLVVLTTKTPDTWDRDFKAFEDVVRGHQFFNCGRPELAIPCR